MKRKRNVINSLYIDPKELEDLVIERYKKYAEVEKNEVRFETENTDDADIVLVAYGTTARIATAAMRMAREEGIKAGLIRPITLWPFPTEIIAKTAKTCKAMISVEMSMGQMIEDVKLAANGACPVHFYGRTGGMVPDPKSILAKIKEVM